MTDCEYCKKPLDAGDNNGEYHDVCSVEYDRRHMKNICVRCGANGIFPEYKYYCITCAYDGSFEDYPGPQ